MANRRRLNGAEGPKPIGEILGQVLAGEKYAALPTVYRGVQFRSRLEATWAAFFDLCEWKWSYEPEEQGGWIPDFTLGHEPTFVEVKPFRRHRDWGKTIRKIASSCQHRYIVLLGADPTFFDTHGSCETGAPQIGWLLDREGPQTIAWDLNFGFVEGRADRSLGLCSLEGPWWNVIFDFEGHEYANKMSRVWPDEPNGICGIWSEEIGPARYVLETLWTQARNATQWKPPVRND